MQHIYVARGFEPEMIADADIYAAIEETCRILSEGVDSAIKREVPQELIDHLHDSTFLFSGFKTYHEAREVSARLLDTETGTFKTFDKFYEEVRSIHERYNQNYLRAEYNFAVQSTQMAVRWHKFEQDGDRYLLQYRTANDGHVRPEHQALHNTTLPIGDPFWNDYTPPLGWNCRCTVVQVNRGKYPESDSAAAIRAGEEATAKPKQQIFRFNPGKTERVFPPRHPYLPKGCGNCQFRTERRLGYKPDNPLCQACDILVKSMNDATIEEHRKAFDQLVKSGNYTDLEFNPETGAYKATHIGHISHDNPNEQRFFSEQLSATQLEKECHNILFRHGYTTILCDESIETIRGCKDVALDLLVNGKHADIASIVKESQCYRNQLIKKNGQNNKFNHLPYVEKKADTVCLYFHDPKLYNAQKVIDGYQGLLDFQYKDESTGEMKHPTINVRHVICVINEGNGSVETFDF